MVRRTILTALLVAGLCACGPEKTSGQAGESATTPAATPAQEAAPAAVEKPAEAPAPAAVVPRVADLPTLDHAGLLARVKGGGKKATLVAVWATWCVPCIEEMPTLSAYYEAHRGEGLEIIGLSMDDKTRMADKIQAVLDRQKVAYPMALIAPGAEEAFMGAVSAEWDGALPAAILYDGDGGQKGFVTEKLTEEALAKLVSPLLGR